MNSKMYRILFVVTAAALLLAAVPGWAQFWYGDNIQYYNLQTYQAGSEQVTLVPNGDFEGGSTGWTFNPSNASIGSVPGPVSTGNAFRITPETAASAANTDGLVTLEANTRYVASAYIFNYGSAALHLRPVFSVFQLSPWAQMVTLPVFWDANGVNDNPDYYMASAEFTTPAAGQYWTGLQYVENPGGTGWQFSNLGAAFDNVAITKLSDYRAPTVPEPGTLSALGFGLMSLGGIALRRFRK